MVHHSFDNADPATAKFVLVLGYHLFVLQGINKALIFIYPQVIRIVFFSGQRF